jgi:hypothetical protein
VPDGSLRLAIGRGVAYRRFLNGDGWGRLRRLGQVFRPRWLLRGENWASQQKGRQQESSAENASGHQSLYDPTSTGNRIAHDGGGRDGHACLDANRLLQISNRHRSLAAMPKSIL